MKTPQPESCSQSIARILRTRLGIDLTNPPGSIDEHEHVVALAAALAEAWAAGAAASHEIEAQQREKQQERILREYLDGAEF